MKIISKPSPAPYPFQPVLDFWFDEDTKPLWFAKSDDFDNQLSDKFLATWQAVTAGECAGWRETTKGAVAEIIVLDQFSRNLKRDTPQAFAYDGMALVLAQELLKREEFDKLPQAYQRFALMPFMHSESKRIHERALELFEQLGDADTLAFEKKHKAIIDRFGRYPHRNAILGRESTNEEMAFLSEPNSSF